MIYDFAIIGAGPAGLFAALDIVSNSNANVVILEKAKRLNDSRNIGLAWLGGSARSAAKIFVEPNFGGIIQDADIIQKFILDFEKHYGSKLRFGGKPFSKKQVKELQDSGIALEVPASADLTEEKMIKMGDNIYAYLKNNATVLHKMNVTAINKVNDIFEITTQDNVIRSKKVMLSLGRTGKNIIDNMSKNFTLESSGDSYDLGLKLEFPFFFLKEFANNKNYSFRFKYDSFRTTVPVIHGLVETEEVLHLRTANSRVSYQGKRNSVSMTLFKTFTALTSDAQKECFRLAEIANVLSDSQLIRESYDKFLSKESALYSLEEYRSFIPGLEKLIKLFPGVQSRCTIHAPEFRANTAKYKLTSEFETNTPGLYVAGDMSGYTCSFGQAAMSGLIVSNKFLKEKVENGKSSKENSSTL